ncbi:MAG: type II toxin-antitoxin system PemK/MazF family toxin [Cryomorphaceae bacterium]|nr:type II toxin-antitoxin system PemK/MazF family toxin [Flavobacteriales bacterium]
MKQCEIWWAELNPVKGREQSGRRPVLVVSGNLLNENTDIVIVCPLTTQLKRYHGNLILDPSKKNGLQKTSEVLTWQMRTLAKKRLVERMGHIPITEVEKVHRTLGDILKY